MRKRLLAFSVTSSFLLVFGLFTAPMAQAFSGYGDGSSGTPYRIGTCAQLSEIDNDLAGNYIIIRNLDCSGLSFNALAQSSDFTGTLNGQWHTIYNLNIASGSALFTQTGGATIKNLSIDSGSVNSDSNAASFAGFAENDSVFQDLHSGMTISGLNYCGGLVGDLDTGSSIDDSSFSGNLTCGQTGGGLAGDVFGFGNGESISNSFSSGTFHVIDPGMGAEDVGGLVGDLRAATESISDSYSSMTINVDADAYAVDVGGLVGYAGSNTITDSFSAATINATNNVTYVGGIDGGHSATYNNDYFDQTLAGGVSCTGSGTAGGCNPENSDGNTPDYFQLTTDPPMDNWTFSDYPPGWQVVDGDYPTLINMTLYGGSEGDLNGDGIDDSLQPTVYTVPDRNDVPVTITIPSNSTCSLDDGQWIDNGYFKADTGYTPLKDTMTQFNVYCPTPGMTVPITLLYDKVYDTSHAVLQYFDTGTGTYSTITGAVFGTQTINGTPVTTVTYSLTDGGPYDGDGTSNGLIQDPVGMSVPITSGSASQNSQSGGTLTDTGIDILIATGLAILFSVGAITTRFIPSKKARNKFTPYS